METEGKVGRLVSRVWAAHGYFREEVPHAEDEPELLELDRAAELYREAGIPWPAAGDARDDRWALRPVSLARRVAPSSAD